MSAARSSSYRLPREISILCNKHIGSKQQSRLVALRGTRPHRYVSSLSSGPPPTHLDFPNLPKFSARGSDVQVLRNPDQFYAFLLDSIRRAKKRIFLASLYIGKEETELIHTLHEALRANPSLELHVVTDFLRSTREHPKSTSSASLVASLHASFPTQVHLSLYHTPALHGLLKRIVPKRYNEGWGLWHGKIYGFDDDVMLSGANLSKDYFTNRQDRYIAFRNHAPFADYLHELVSLFGKLSYSVKGRSAVAGGGDNFDLAWKGEIGKPDAEPIHNPNSFSEAANERLGDFMGRWMSKSSSSLSAHSSSGDKALDTLIQPFLQMGQFDIKQETDIVIPTILDQIQHSSDLRLDWTSGYFSLRAPYKDGLLKTEGPVRIVCASPEANGFYQSPGFSKYIPPAYTYAEAQFWQAIKTHSKQDKIQIQEWRKSGWTYHSKGIWLSQSQSNAVSDVKEAFRPRLTLIGSSNYGYRSAVRDVEINAVVQTTSEELSNALGAEISNIREHATDNVNDELFKRKDRYVGPINRLAARVIADML